jgi:membrane-bound ClpP family serine protease
MPAAVPPGQCPAHRSCGPFDPSAGGGDNEAVLFVIGVLLALFVVPGQWAVPVIVVAAVVEISETLLTLWWSRRAPPKVGVETLIGMVGRAVTDCRPTGTVRVRGEVWRARSERGVAAGEQAQVQGRDRLTLLVEPSAGLSSDDAVGR